MEWVSSNSYLAASDQQNNARLVYEYFSSKGVTLNAIAAMLGNMQVESTINPGVWGGLEYGSGAYGLVQWLPSSNFTDWADANGYSWEDGAAQCQWIYEQTVPAGQWIATSSYQLTFTSFLNSNKTPEYLASAFLFNFERAGSATNQLRRTNARTWFDWLCKNATVSFDPRLNSDGMEGSKYYYSDNIFYLSGYGLPNCTAYAWGRYYEITDTYPSNLCIYDARDWYPWAVDHNDNYGQEPRPGAVLCIDYAPSGHVAIVEQVNENGSIVISQSAYNGTYFWTEVCYPENNYLPTWAINNGGVLQGFIYLPSSFVPPPINPVIKEDKKKKFNWLLFGRKKVRSWTGRNF